MEVGARAATASDLEILTDLAATAIDELTPKRGGDVWRREAARSEPLEDSLRADLDDDANHVVAGTIDEVPVGYAAVRVETLRDGTKLGRVTDLFTLADARAVGVGEAMMNDLMAFCANRGCFGVDSLALPGDRHTKNFFESFGLVARAIVVHRSLDS
ncbi:MAG: GNAT family N-acetyltransferase [Acidimicrobiales bacterium]|nr:GNAT family N-acetyltransferase [Acidimicrobiales bacterium]